MRIIAGKYKGRKLFSFEGKDIRPTSDRAREGLFSVLQFEIEGKSFLDAFCGSGAVGLEALSRGANRAVLVDVSKISCELARENCAALNADACVVCENALDYLRRTNERFDIIFLDPPYKYQSSFEALEIISRRGLLNKNGVCVIERESADNRLIDGLFIEKVKKYGIAKLTFYRKCDDETCVFAGSFDPVTKGHIAVVKSALKKYKKVIAALGVNSEKKYTFSKKERLEMLSAAFDGVSGVEVVDFDGLLVDFMRGRKVRFNVRGIRDEKDELYENEMLDFNRKLYPEIINDYITCAEELKSVSSTAARKALIAGDSVENMLPSEVEKLAKAYLERKNSLL